MGLDLCFYVVANGDNPGNSWYPTAKLDTDRDYSLYDAIKELSKETLPLVGIKFSCDNGDDRRPDGERKYGRATVDSYGDRLTYTTAGILSSLCYPDFIWSLSEVNQATLAYLRTLPSNWIVVLYWH